MSASHPQSGGRIDPASDWRLWRLTALIHFLRSPDSYRGKQRTIRPFKYQTLTTQIKNKPSYMFPTLSNGQPLDHRYPRLIRGFKLKHYQSEHSLYQADSGRPYTEKNLFQHLPLKGIEEKRNYLKAVADNLWGFLKQKEGDLKKEENRQTLRSAPDFTANKNTNYGHTIGTGTFARKIAELISSIIIIHQGVKADWIYDPQDQFTSKSDKKGSRVYPLFLKNLLVKLLLVGDQSQKNKVFRILKQTSVDMIVSRLWADQSLKKLLRKSVSLDLYEQLEQVRYLGNRSAHAGQPGDWDPKLSDYEQQQLAEAVHDLLDTFLHDHLNLQVG